MITISRTISNNPDFINLVGQLDKYLTGIFGEVQKYYDQFNELSNLGAVVVAHENEKPVGCGGLRQFDTETVELKRMFVPQEHRQKGIASLVLFELEDWARELGYKKIILETGTALQEANRFYQKHGYRISDKWGQYVGVDTSVCMQKEIA